MEEDEGRRFASWYDVGSQYDEILHRAQELLGIDQKPKQTGQKNRMDTRSALKAKQEKAELRKAAVLAGEEFPSGPPLDDFPENSDRIDDE